jgi:hypothetical protein
MEISRFALFTEKNIAFDGLHRNSFTGRTAGSGRQKIGHYELP